MKKRHKRLAAIVIGFSGLAIAVTLILQVFNSNINVFYSPSEVQPDLFREGQGVIAQGKLNDKGVFVADEVLAKHDESYIAPEVQDALDKAEAQKTAATEPDAVIPEKK